GQFEQLQQLDERLIEAAKTFACQILAPVARIKLDLAILDELTPGAQSSQVVVGDVQQSILPRFEKVQCGRDRAAAGAIGRIAENEYLVNERDTKFNRQTSRVAE